MSLVLSELAFHVLLALGDGPSHGYAIGKDVEDRSGGRLDPTTGALYQALRRRTEDGLVAPADSPPATDSRRKYFALTARGRRAAVDRHDSPAPLNLPPGERRAPDPGHPDAAAPALLAPAITAFTSSVSGAISRGSRSSMRALSPDRIWASARRTRRSGHRP